jgi:hypothetical protein
MTKADRTKKLEQLTAHADLHQKLRQFGEEYIIGVALAG